ncbi:MAG: ISAs1 family transposase [Methylococcales bacterium]|nr:ISAs1 family transposase [Methylococcales bacterium]
MGHGRIEQRHYSIAEISPITAGLPSAQSASLVRREWVYKGEGLSEVRTHDRYFLSSLPSDQAEWIAKKVRGHWSIENKNHYKKDTSQWREDDHRHRRVNTAQNLALMRSALLAIIPFDEDQRLNDLLETYNKQPQLAIRLIQKAPPR